MSYFNIFGSLTKLNLIGKERSVSQRELNRAKNRTFTTYIAETSIYEESVYSENDTHSETETILEHKEISENSNEAQFKNNQDEQHLEGNGHTEYKETGLIRKKNLWKSQQPTFFEKNNSPLVSKRYRKILKTDISAPTNYRQINNEFTVSMRQQLKNCASAWKKSKSLDNLQAINEEFDDRKSGTVDFEYKKCNFSETKVRSDFGSSDSERDSDVDIDQVFEDFKSNLVQLRTLSQSTPELLKSVSQHENEALSSTLKKFPVDDVTLRQDSIQANRRSKTVDYSIQGKPILTALPNRSFEIKGVVTIQSSDGLKQIVNRGTDWIQYQNQELWMVTGKKHKKHLRSDVHIDKINYVKDSKEVTLTTVNNVIYTLIFSSAKEARQFSDKYRTPVSAVKNMLLKFLGKRKSREYLEQKGIYKDEPIFGNTLEGICKNTGEPVPVFILNIIDLIEKPENIKSLGLYRTSGNLATIQKIRLQVDKGNLDILNDYPKDPDVLTGTLKLFFRELKEPLIPYQVCERLPDVMKLDLKQLTFKDHQKIKNTLTQYLSEANYRTFSVLIQHFIVVVDNKEWNKMDSYNLAICWALSMISPSPSLNDTTTLQYTKDMVSLSHDATRLIDFLIGYFSMYPNELKNTRMGSVSEMFSPLNRQESKDSVESGDSSTKSYRKSKSTSSLSVDVVTKTAIDLIEAYSSPDREGLYKKPGNSDKINKIIKRLNKKKSHELVKYKNDVHEIAAALKKHLSESEKLVDVQTVEQLATVYEKATSSPELKTRENVMALIEQSPKKDTLLYLLRHLDKVASKQDIYHISKNDLIDIWTEVLNRDNRIHPSRKKFSNFLAIAIDVGNLPDVVPLTVNNNGNTQYTEVMKDLINHQERNRGSRYDNIDCGVIDNNEQTKL